MTGEELTYRLKVIILIELLVILAIRIIELSGNG